MLLRGLSYGLGLFERSRGFLEDIWAPSVVFLFWPRGNFKFLEEIEGKSWKAEVVLVRSGVAVWVFFQFAFNVDLDLEAVSYIYKGAFLINSFFSFDTLLALSVCKASFWVESLADYLVGIYYKVFNDLLPWTFQAGGSYYRGIFALLAVWN